MSSAVIQPMDSSPGVTGATVDPEVVAKARRRTYTAAYKQRILAELDACKQPGEVGAVLRREGLYSSHINTWRRQRDEAGLRGLAPKQRGRKGKSAADQEMERLRKENERLRKRLQRADTLLELQKKVFEIYGATPPSLESEKDNEDV